MVRLTSTLFTLGPRLRRTLSTASRNCCKSGKLLVPWLVSNSFLRLFSRAHWPSTSGRMISTTCLDLAESSPLFGCSDFSLRAMPNMPVPRCSPAEDDGVRGVHQATVTDSARGVVEIRSRQQSPVLATIGRYPARPAPERRRLTPAVPVVWSV